MDGDAVVGLVVLMTMMLRIDVENGDEDVDEPDDADGRGVHGGVCNDQSVCMSV